MELKTGKTGEETDGGEKKNQSKLLVLLLILVAGGGYIYFFTDLIKPSQEQKPAEAVVAAQVVKKPLPSADGKVPAKTEVASPEGAEAKKPEPAAKPEPAKVVAASAPAPAPVAKPAEQKQPEKKADALQPAVKKPLPAAGAKPGEAKPAPAEKKQPAAAEAKPAPIKDGDKKAADVKKAADKPAVVAAQPKKDAPKPAKSEPAVVKDAASGKWTVVVGNYVLEEALATDLAKVRKAGVEASIAAGGTKKTHMNRLLLAEFTERESAQAELAKLKRHTSDAFILQVAGMHQVYAGSYMLDSRAASEKERLAAAGFSLTLKRADVSIASKNLIAGPFSDKKAADEMVKKLRSNGINAVVGR